MIRPLTQPSSLGYKLLPGKSRRYQNVRTGETISYNAFRRLANARSSSAVSKVNLFEQVLARSNDLELARRESRLSGREFEQYRHSFGNRESASPFVKEHGRTLDLSRGARLPARIPQYSRARSKSDFQRSQSDSHAGLSGSCQRSRPSSIGCMGGGSPKRCEG
jgi:hypothetical protein